MSSRYSVRFRLDLDELPHADIPDSILGCYYAHLPDGPYDVDLHVCAHCERGITLHPDTCALDVLPFAVLLCPGCLSHAQDTGVCRHCWGAIGADRGCLRNRHLAPPPRS